MAYLQFAAALEASIRQAIEEITQHAPEELQPFMAAAAKYQVEFELLIDRAQYTDIDTGRYPEVELEILFGPDTAWQKLMHSFATTDDKIIANLTALWMISALIEKSAQFYQQASLNNAHPAGRLFLRSLAETKSMLRRRIDGLVRIISNEVWSDLGFSPAVLGKD